MIEYTQVLIPSLKCSLDHERLQWDAALRDAASRRASALQEPALIVVVAMADARGTKTLRTHVTMSFDSAPIAMVLGAHPLCDVPNVHGAALRHVVLVVDPRECPGWVTAVDLNTADGITVDGEGGIRRVDARYSLRLQAGSADVFCVSLVPGQNIDVPTISAFLAAPALRPSPESVASSRDGRAPRQAARAPAPAPGNVTKEMVTLVAPLSQASGVLFIKPTEAELRVGLVLGRYDRCTSRLDDGLVSRVHVLILPRRNGDLLVIDAGSTNGTLIAAPNSRATRSLGVVKRAALCARGVRLSIGGSVVEIA
ncbi:MAG TPA: FHA domain-containing protein [Myxococcota bacterium]|jgi:hypothetical protein